MDRKFLSSFIQGTYRSMNGHPSGLQDPVLFVPEIWNFPKFYDFIEKKVNKNLQFLS